MQAASETEPETSTVNTVTAESEQTLRGPAGPPQLSAEAPTERPSDSDRKLWSVQGPDQSDTGSDRPAGHGAGRTGSAPSDRRESLSLGRAAGAAPGAARAVAQTSESLI